jgi:hypothetical protein
MAPTKSPSAVFLKVQIKGSFLPTKTEGNNKVIYGIIVLLLIAPVLSFPFIKVW